MRSMIRESIDTLNNALKDGTACRSKYHASQFTVSFSKY
jgi:hypothetical protein